MEKLYLIFLNNLPISIPRSNFLHFALFNDLKRELKYCRDQFENSSPDYEKANKNLNLLSQFLQDPSTHFCSVSKLTHPDRISTNQSIYLRIYKKKYEVPENTQAIEIEKLSILSQEMQQLLLTIKNNEVFNSHASRINLPVVFIVRAMNEMNPIEFDDLYKKAIAAQSQYPETYVVNNLFNSYLAHPQPFQAAPETNSLSKEETMEEYFARRNW